MPATCRAIEGRSVSNVARMVRSEIRGSVGMAEACPDPSTALRTKGFVAGFPRITLGGFKHQVGGFKHQVQKVQRDAA